MDNRVDKRRKLDWQRGCSHLLMSPTHPMCCSYIYLFIYLFIYMLLVSIVLDLMLHLHMSHSPNPPLYYTPTSSFFQPFILYTLCTLGFRPIYIYALHQEIKIGLWSQRTSIMSLLFSNNKSANPKNMIWCFRNDFEFWKNDGRIYVDFMNINRGRLLFWSVSRSSIRTCLDVIVWEIKNVF